MKATRLTRLVAATGATSMLALCPLAPAQAANGVLLRYTFKAGQASTYAVSIKVSQVFVTQKTSYSDQLTLLQRVAQLYSDGSATLRNTYTNSTLATNGEVVPLKLTGVSSVQRVARNGAVLSTKATGATAQTGLLYLAGDVNVRPLLPGTAVAIGKSWSTQQRLSLGHLGVFMVQQRFKLAAVKAQGGHQIAQIQVSGNQPVHMTHGILAENGTLGSAGTIQFDTTSGGLSALHEQVQQKLTVTATSKTAQGKHVSLSFTAVVDVVRKS